MPGGSMINSLRTFNYLMIKKHARKHSALFFGAIGTDDKGKFVKRLFEEEGIEFKFDEHDDYPTDLCAVVIVDKERTPVIYCEANHQFRTQHIVENFELLSKCKMLYVEAFFITSNYEAVFSVANYANENNISFAFNIGGEYWIENYSDKFIEIFPHCDVLFGNFKEFKSLAKILGYETQNAEKCVKFVASYNTDNTSNKTPRSIKERLVLISMDKNGAILDKYTFETDTHEIVTVSSIKLEDHEVIDTSCAGMHL